MELTFTNLIMIIAGVLALAVSIAVYVYFNGGIDTLVNLIFGAIR